MPLEESKRRRRPAPRDAPPSAPPPSAPPPPSDDFARLVRAVRESERRHGLETRRALPEDPRELSRREQTLLRAEPGAPDDVVDAEIVAEIPAEVSDADGSKEGS